MHMSCPPAEICRSVCSSTRRSFYQIQWKTGRRCVGRLHSRGAADSTAIRREPQFRCNIKQRFRLHASLSRLSFLSLRLWLFHHAAPPVFFFVCMAISCFFFSFLRFFSICLGLYFMLFPRFSSFLSSVCVSTSFLLQFLLSPTLRKVFFFFVSLYLSLSTSYLSSLLCISYFFYSVTNLSPHLSTCVNVCFLVCVRACSSNPRFICLWPLSLQTARA